MVFEQVSIIVIASHNPRRGQNVTSPIGDGQHIGGLGPLATLISHCLTTLLRHSMTAIQIHLRQIQVGTKMHNTRLPDPLQTPIGTPLLPMIVHRLPTWFVSRRPFARNPRYGQSIPLTAAMQPIQHKIEDFPQWLLAHIAPFGYPQMRLDVLLELFFGYTYRYSAHEDLLLPEFGLS